MTTSDVSLHDLTDRAAMGCPEGYAATRLEEPSVLFEKLRFLKREELAWITENPSETLARRYAAGRVLAWVRDIRINPLHPVMLRVSGAEVFIGLDPVFVDSVLEKYAGTGIRREWIEKETPRVKARLASYRIAKYPVTNLEYLAFLKDHPGHPQPTSWEFGKFPHERANHPVYTVLPEGADAYAAWLSRKTGRPFRLPAEFEWEYAAAGPRGWEFPWGNDWEEGRANTVESGILSSTPVGIFPSGNSYFGAADMAGNVEEYVSDSYRPYPGGPDIQDDLVKALGSYRVARGGSFTRFRDLARTRRRHGCYPKSIYAVGFRLAEDA